MLASGICRMRPHLSCVLLNWPAPCLSWLKPPQLQLKSNLNSLALLLPACGDLYCTAWIAAPSSMKGRGYRGVHTSKAALSLLVHLMGFGGMGTVAGVS